MARNSAAAERAPHLRKHAGTGASVAFLTTILIGALGCHASSEKASKLPGDLTNEEYAALLELTLPEGVAAPVDPTNALLADANKLPLAQALGHRAFFDPRFSGPLLDPDHKVSGSKGLGMPGDVGKIACVSCHVPTSGFQDTRSPRAALSLGAGWTPRKAISLLNVSFGKLFMWDGRHDALWNQIFTPFEKHVEMNSGRLFVAQELAKDTSYRQSYEQLFGVMPPLLDPSQYPLVERGGCLADSAGDPIDCHGMPGDNAEYDSLPPDKKDAVTRVVANLGKALQSYERLIRCGPGRFDAWMSGDESALSAEEQRGARLFVGKGACVRCHNGAFFTDFGFHNVGLEPGGPQVLFMTKNDPGAKVGVEDLEKSDVNTTGAFSDDRSVRRFSEPIPTSYDGAFKTPSLRCSSGRPSYFHTGQYVSLDDVVSFKSRGGHASGYAGASEIEPLDLTSEEQSDLVAFIESLDELPGTGTPEEWKTAP